VQVLQALQLLDLLQRRALLLTLLAGDARGLDQLPLVLQEPLVLATATGLIHHGTPPGDGSGNDPKAVYRPGRDRVNACPSC